MPGLASRGRLLVTPRSIAQVVAFDLVLDAAASLSERRVLGTGRTVASATTCGHLPAGGTEAATQHRGITASEREAHLPLPRKRCMTGSASRRLPGRAPGMALSINSLAGIAGLFKLKELSSARLQAAISARIRARGEIRAERCRSSPGHRRHAGRAFGQERVLAQHSDYAAYRKPVRRRLHNGVWQRVHRAE